MSFGYVILVDVLRLTYVLFPRWQLVQNSQHMRRHRCWRRRRCCSGNRKRSAPPHRWQLCTPSVILMLSIHNINLCFYNICVVVRVVILNMESGDIRFLLETVVVTVDICYMVVYGKPGSKSYRNWSASPPIETNIAAMETKNLLSKKDFL